MERWVGKNSVVTGASFGIGRAIAKALAIGGMNVIGLARNEKNLEELSKELQDIKGSFQYVVCDLRNEDDILKAFEFVEKKFGGVDVLINNAAVMFEETIAEGSTETFRVTLEVNVLGPAICIRETMKSMRKQKNEGHIININSVLGLHASIPHVNLNIYPASKFALRAMTDTVRDEIALNKDNIRVTGIYPGLVNTNFMDHSHHKEEIFDTIPALNAEQIVNCVIFSLSAPPKTQVQQIVLTQLNNS